MALGYTAIILDIFLFVFLLSVNASHSHEHTDWRTNLNVSFVNGSESVIISEGDTIHVDMFIMTVNDAASALSTGSDVITGNTAMTGSDTSTIFMLEARIENEDVARVENGSRIILNQ